jgi:hypothetical protein
MVTLNVRCPLCGSKHKWRYKDAWMEGEEPRPAYGIRGENGLQTRDPEALNSQTAMEGCWGAGCGGPLLQ